jgi:hypothetical protein
MFFGDALAAGNADVAVNECPQFGERLKCCAGGRRFHCLQQNLENLR